MCPRDESGWGDGNLSVSMSPLVIRWCTALSGLSGCANECLGSSRGSQSLGAVGESQLAVDSSQGREEERVEGAGWQSSRCPPII